MQIGKGGKSSEEKGRGKMEGGGREKYGGKRGVRRRAECEGGEGRDERGPF
jgi:hypothetical protein